jgi:hypothetical protein
MRTILEIFRPPSAAELAQRELDNAERNLLLAKTNFDYACSQVTFEEARIKRLRVQVAQNVALVEPAEAATNNYTSRTVKKVAKLC